MLVRPAEDSFRRGIAALEQGRGVEALAFLEGALTIERRLGVGRPQARYLSFYGLCLGVETKRLAEGIRCCRDALALEFFNADLRFNLGRLLVRAGERGEAYATFQEGLRLEPRHPGILRELGRMGKRRRLPVAFLARSNPVNVILGRLTHAGTDRGKDRTARTGRPAPSRRAAVR
jgi:tetratricopeptide (TPR) repeat protein